MLNALALGARELAGLPPLSSSSSTALIERTSRRNDAFFPSKRLPHSLHRRLIALQDDAGAGDKVIEGLVHGIVGRIGSSKGVEGIKEAGQDNGGSPARSRRLRMTKKPLIEEVSREFPSSRILATTGPSSKKAKRTYLTYAAGTFIHPLLSAFFDFLRSENYRELRTQHLAIDERYVSSGTGLILNPMVLEAFLGTTLILFDLARNAVEYLSILMPLGIELVLAMGAMCGNVISLDNKVTEQNEKEKSMAALLTPSLELAQLLITSSLAIDNGRALALEQASLLLALSEWASSIFQSLEKGRRVGGIGGKYEERMWRSVVGVLSVVDDIKRRWGRSMLGLSSGY